MPTVHLTAAMLRNQKPPSSGVLELWDTASRGLCFRIFESGKATWCYRYRPKDGSGRKRIGLGDYPTVGLSEARKRADRHRGNVSDGEDPAAELKAKRNAPTLDVNSSLKLA
jgi:hypothetical protein